MKIVDLRPAIQRGWLGAWDTAVGAPRSAWPEWLIGATAWPADAWLGLRRRRRPIPPRRPFIVSVGNLALGGTGKTPVAAALAVALAASGRRGAIITRGYGSPLAGPLTVAPDDRAAGDEARMLAAQVAPGGWTIVQARRRDRGLRYLASHAPDLDVVILEDGHQNGDVGRHLDIVILDGWRPVEAASGPAAGGVRPVTGPVFPWGPWRESARGARPAAIWLLETEVPPPPAPPPAPILAGFARSYRLADRPAPGRRVALLSGIARPAAFEQAATRALSAAPVLSVRCADHERYAPDRLRRIREELARAQIDVVVTTAKDRVKLGPQWPAGIDLLTLAMDVAWTGAKALPDLVEERLDAVRSGIGPAV